MGDMAQSPVTAVPPKSRTLSEELAVQRADFQRINERLQQQNQTLLATESQLRNSEAEARKLALVASRTDNAVIVTDGLGRVEWVNDGFTRITGFTLADVEGRTPGSVLQGPGTHPGTVEFMRGHLRKGVAFSTEG